MDKTFDEAIAGIRKAERGVEVREDIAQGMEYVKQYAEEVTDQQQAALQAAQTATGAASTATKKAAEAAQSERSASADAKSAGSSAASAEESANRAAAVVSTDKTLSVEGAPADAKAVGEALKNLNIRPATSTTLGGIKVGSGLSVADDGTLSVDIVIPEVDKLTAYPVGSIYQSTSYTSPAALFGGTWQEIAQNRVLMGASYAHAAGTTVEAGLPNITGSFVANVRSSNHEVSGAFTVGNVIAYTGGNSSDAYTYKFSLDASKSNAIYGRSATVQPAAYYVHIWKRVA
nr:MAG TPA: baseplate protein [Caudoviricetes sp.]